MRLTSTELQTKIQELESELQELESELNSFKQQLNKLQEVTKAHSKLLGRVIMFVTHEYS